MFLHIFIFIISCFVLFRAGSWLVESLAGIAKFLRWREFVVAFFVMAFACSLPNLFVGLNSAINGVPQLSFGDIVGGNVINLTLAAALAVLFSKDGLALKSRMVQSSVIFSTIIAILPIALIWDANLSRLDGAILIFAFVFYVLWLFSEEKRFKKVYKKCGEENVLKSPFSFIKDSARVAFSLVLLLLAAHGLVRSSIVFSETLNVPLVLIGILVVGLGNALPEIYFGIASARKNQDWMILGDLIGSVVYTSTLVLGIVALISPIQIVDFSPFLIARIFLVISALFFLLIVRTDRKITKTEGVILLGIYVFFLLAEILIK